MNTHDKRGSHFPIRTVFCAVVMAIFSFPAYSGSYSDVVHQMDTDFFSLSLGHDFEPTSHGYKKIKDIVAAPGMRMSAYMKFYETSETAIGTVGITIYQGRILGRSQLLFMADKTACMDSSALLIEDYIKKGLGNWERERRTDDQAAHWKSKKDGFYISVTCRMSEGTWMLDHQQGMMLDR